MGGGKGSNTTKSTFKLPPEFIKAYSESLGLARQAIQQPYTPYTGQLVAGLTPGQQQGIANIQASQGMALPFIQEGAGLTREAARGITPELYKQYYSPYIRDVAEATQANLLESAARQRSDLKSGAIGAGAFGGDRSGIAQAEMARLQQMANAQNLSNIYEQGYRNAMGLAGQQVQNLGAMGGQLAGMGTTAQTSALQGAQAQLAAGAQEQATNQAQLQAAYDQFLQQQSYPFQIAQFFANIAQGLGSTAGGTSSTTAPGPNAGSQILGGLGAIANIAGSLPPSDKRVKENIEAVGTLNDGQTVYRYNFKGNPQTQIGLLAQEVEEVKPGSVVEVGGIKRVDYKGATDDAASSMGGVVGPGDDRQGFMNGGMPYGGVGFVPNSPMMAGASNKIPGAATPAPDAGLAGAADMTQPFTDQQKQGVANIAGLFQKPSIYNAGGVVGRGGYAEGGVPFMPYSGGRGWVPEGKLGGGGSSIPSAPNAYEDKGLAEDWQDIKPLTDDQASNLRQLPGRIKGLFADPDTAAATYMTQPSIYETYDPAALTNDGFGEAKEIAGRPFTYALASGGVAGRGGYQFGGEPTMEEAMVEAEAMRQPQGVAAAEVAPRRGVGDLPAPSGYSNAKIAPVSAEKAPDGVSGAEQGRTPFSFKNLFASEERPSIIESILGRRLSPEARAAALNASFALMAGRSPNFMVNLGEAGRVGTQAYYNAVQQKQAREQQAAELAQQQYGAQTSRMIAETARDKAVREQQEQAARDQMLEEAIAQLPPDQQAAARLAPDKFVEQQVKSMFPEAPPSGGWGGTIIPLRNRETGELVPGQFNQNTGGVFIDGEPADPNQWEFAPDALAEAKAAGTITGEAPRVVYKLYMEKTRPEMAAISAGVAAMREAEKYLKQGIETGSMADAVQALRSLGARLGFNVDEEVLSNTQSYQNFIGEIVIPRMAALGGNDSNEELRRLYSLSGGDITQSLEALKNTLKFMDELLERKFNSLKPIENIALQYLPGMEPIPYGYGLPPETSVTTEMPDFSKMTDEELEAYVNEQQ